MFVDLVYSRKCQPEKCDFCMSPPRLLWVFGFVRLSLNLAQCAPLVSSSHVWFRGATTKHMSGVWTSFLPRHHEHKRFYHQRLRGQSSRAKASNSLVWKFKIIASCFEVKVPKFEVQCYSSKASASKLQLQ